MDAINELEIHHSFLPRKRTKTARGANPSISDRFILPVISANLSLKQNARSVHNVCFRPVSTSLCYKNLFFALLFRERAISCSWDTLSRFGHEPNKNKRRRCIYKIHNIKYKVKRIKHITRNNTSKKITKDI